MIVNRSLCLSTREKQQEEVKELLEGYATVGNLS